MSGVEILVLEDATDLFDAAAREFARAVRGAVARRGVARVALAGGATPRGLYRRLAASPYREWIPWTRVAVYFGDERCVPPEHADSNYRMAANALLAKVPIPRRAVFRIRGEIDPRRAAARYETILAGIDPPRPPRFDLVLLGLGADGHTASLFPGSAALDERDSLAVPAASPAPPRDRVTLTLPVFNAARVVVFLVVGRQKATAVARALGTDSGPARPRAPLPAARVRPRSGRVVWLLDRAAASRLR